MSRVFNNQPDINNQKILLTERIEPGTVEANQNVLYVDDADGFLKLKDDTEVFRIGYLETLVINENQNRNLDSDDDGQIIFYDTQNNVTMTLPLIDDVPFGTHFRIYLRQSPGPGNSLVITTNGGNENNMQGGFYGPEVTNAANYPIAAGNNVITFSNNSNRGDWVDLLSDGQCWLIHGFTRTQNAVTIT